jgi:hypothetical protein
MNLLGSTALLVGADSLNIETSRQTCEASASQVFTFRESENVAETLGQQIVGFYRGWQNLALKESAEQAWWVLVDDLYPKSVSVPQLHSKADIEAALQQLLVEWEASSSPYKAYTKAKLNQSLMYLRQAEQKKKVSREDIIARGVPWFVPERTELESLRTTLKQQRADAENALRAKGDDPESYFGEVLDPARAAAFLKSDGDFWLTQASAVWGIPTSDVSYDVEARHLKASFQNLVVTEQGRIKLLLNSAIGGVFTRAHLRFLAIHEVLGHVLHFTRMRQKVEVCRDAPQLLCITIHTFDALHVEGVAQIMAEAMVQANVGRYPEIACQISWGNLFMAVRHRNIVRLISGEISPEVAASEHADLMDVSVNRIPALTAMYTERLTDPFACIQGLVYYASLRSCEHWLKLTPSIFGSRINDLFFGFYGSR